MKELYDKIYTDQTKSNYGHRNHGGEYIDVLRVFRKDKYPSSWLDVGCGHNELIESLRDKKSKPYIQDALGVDFSCPGADQKCDILGMPFPDKRWDFISAFDVLEHLSPETIPDALNEMKRVSKRFMFTIDFRLSVYVIDGVNVHLTVWPRELWAEEIQKAGGIIVRNKGKFFMGNWS